MKSQRTLGALLATFALCFSPVALAAEVDHADHDHQFVRILQTRLRPATLNVGPTDALGWLNYSSKVARISFDKSVAAKLKCTSRSSFQIDGDRLISVKIQASQFASLCQLDAGEYEYQVHLGSGPGIGGAAGLPERILTGKLVVS